MNVAELRRVLSEFDDDLPVIANDPIYGADAAPVIQPMREADSGRVTALGFHWPSVVDAWESVRSRPPASVRSFEAHAKRRKR